MGQPNWSWFPFPILGWDDAPYTSEVSQLQTTSYGLGELLNRAKGGTLTIPQFQREFTWAPRQVKLLVDSMSRSYPIGSLLLLAKSPKLKLSSRHIEAEIAQDYSDKAENTSPTNEVDEEYYILDGQQRTTSIACVFLNAHRNTCYYFDLKMMLKSYREEETSWIVVQKRGKLSPPDRKKNNKLLRADIILNQEKADIYVAEYIEDSGDFPEYQEDKNAARQAAAKIKGIFNTIRHYRVPVIIVERDSGVESICRIFEITNSTGTKLSTFDLAVARFYPEPDLRKLWLSTQEKHQILKSTDTDKDKGFDVDGEHVLKVLYLVTAIRNKYKYIEPTRSNLMSLKTESINKEWDNASKSLAEAYKFAKAQGARPETLPTHSLLVSLAAVHSLMFSDNGIDLFDSWKNHAFIRRWYFSKVMQSSQLQASNYQISQDFQVLLKYARNGERPEFPQVTLNVDTILKLKPSNALYKVLQNIFAITLREDLRSGSEIDSKSRLHDHHIFPKNAGKKYGLDKLMLDNICNRVPMLAESNQSLGEGYPQVYFKEIADCARKEGTLGGLKTRMRDCLIPGDPDDSQWVDSFSIDQFENFCKKRAKLIISRVHEIIGDSLQVNTSPDDELMEDDDE